MDNIELIMEAIAGNESAFEQLIKQESSKLYRTAFLYVGNKEDALDVVQETVFKAFKSIHNLKNPQYFSTWIIKILIRSAYSILEKCKKITVIDYDSIENMQDERVNEIHQSIDLAVALNTLREKHKTAIILFYYHGLPINLISTMMNKPEGTVKSYLRRGKAELKSILEGEYSFEQSMV